MFNNKFRQRLNALFADIKRLAADPVCDSPEIKRDLEELRVRLCRLEAEFLEGEKHSSEVKEVVLSQNSKVEAHPAAPAIYEKEQSAYAFSDDKLESFDFSQSNISHPDHAMTAHLTVSGQTIGEMQIRIATRPCLDF